MGTIQYEGYTIWGLYYMVLYNMGAIQYGGLQLGGYTIWGDIKETFQLSCMYKILKAFSMIIIILVTYNLVLARSESMDARGSLDVNVSSSVDRSS